MLLSWTVLTYSWLLRFREVEMSHKSLSEHERAVYEWQMWVPGFGEEGQEKLKNASVLVSRCGGLGSVVAYELAAAGVGHLILAHGGSIVRSDLNRQLLMTEEGLGTPRVESAARRLRQLNPRLEIEAIPENIGPSLAAEIVPRVDVVVDCAPLFEERMAMNAEAVRHGIPLVECAMYQLDAQITTMLAGRTPCLACLFPESPPNWRRQFPVFGAVSGTIGCLGAMEAIKLISGLGDPLFGRMLMIDFSDMTTVTTRIERRHGCRVCGTIE